MNERTHSLVPASKRPVLSLVKPTKAKPAKTPKAPFNEHRANWLCGWQMIREFRNKAIAWIYRAIGLDRDAFVLDPEDAAIQLIGVVATHDGLWIGGYKLTLTEKAQRERDECIELQRIFGFENPFMRKTRRWGSWEVEQDVWRDELVVNRSATDFDYAWGAAWVAFEALSDYLGRHWQYMLAASPNKHGLQHLIVNEIAEMIVREWNGASLPDGNVVDVVDMKEAA
ncbi:hypothetical protein AKJ09_03693 [Labilithrix luteola]|uniref:Uncharacterized protein n=2 Tax=Labilithrix luteola TaxID=1391654 RepID=A0A0K1PV72_9BACT|nr:hypothetical protein AKJ09_03693 [Labilithrix luteola]